MRKMKEIIIKKNWKKIIGLVLIIIISTSIGGYANSLLGANQVSYNKSGTTMTVQAALDDLNTKANKPEVGDVVNYNANAKDASGTAFETPYSYSANTSDSSVDDYTGSTTEATFKSDDVMTWKILDIKNEINLITLIAADGTPSSLELYGRAGYAYSENILNNISEVYGHGYGATWARSVRIDDINQISGYDPVIDGYCGLNSVTCSNINNYFLELEYKRGKVSVSDLTPKSYSEVKHPVTDVVNAWYWTEDILDNTSNAYKMLCENSSGDWSWYWLASRTTGYDNNQFWYGVLYQSGRTSDKVSLWNAYRNTDYTGEAKPVRPVVRLNKDVHLSYVSTDDGISTWNIE